MSGYGIKNKSHIPDPDLSINTRKFLIIIQAFHEKACIILS